MSICLGKEPREEKDISEQKTQKFDPHEAHITVIIASASTMLILLSVRYSSKFFAYNNI